MLIQKPQRAWQRALRTGIDRTAFVLRMALTFAPLLFIWLAVPCGPVLLLGCVSLGVLLSLKELPFLRAGRWRCVHRKPNWPSTNKGQGRVDAATNELIERRPQCHRSVVRRPA